MPGGLIDCSPCAVVEPPPAPSRGGGSSAVGLVLVWSAILFGYGLTTGQLYRTETLRAQVAAEMLRSGDLVVPTLYGEPLFTKPPGVYWFISLVSFGCSFGEVTEWSARLPSVLAGVGLSLCFYRVFRHQGRLAALVAAAIVPCSPLWLEKAPAAEIDALQVWCVAGAYLIGVQAIESASRSNPDGECATLYWWGMAIFLTLGFFTKWTAPLFVYAGFLTLVGRRGRLRLLLGKGHLSALVVAVVACGTWLVIAGSRGGWTELIDTVQREFLVRFSPGSRQHVQELLAEHHHSSLPWWAETLLHPFLILAATLPWSPFALLTLRPGFADRWDDRGKLLLQALHCWTWPNIFLWSLVPDHAVRNCFPLFPGIAGLAAMVWIDWLRHPPAAGTLLRRVANRWVLIGILATWAVIKIAYVELKVARRDHDRDPRGKGALVAECVPVDRPLYLFRLKDEGVMFYSRRLGRRLAEPTELPSASEPLYCILTEPEWLTWPLTARSTVLRRLQDTQGAPILVVRVEP